MATDQLCTGIFDTQDGRTGFVRPVSTEMKPGRDDAFVSPAVALGNRLRNGSLVEGTCAAGPRGLQITSVESVNGLPTGDWMKTKDFDSLTPVHPRRQIVLAPGADNPSMRVIDLVAPIGEGQRALIVAPPRSGKTRLLIEIADSVSAYHPEMKLVVLLLDERPEEVTAAIRAVKGQVFASSNDQDARNHTRLARLALDYAKRCAEVGEHVVLLLDSLTRLGRSANLIQSGPGRTLSGGIDARALALPRHIFGAARELEEAGSITIVATALVETNSRMDEFIYQDFKGTGNCEIVLRRDLAEQRIFPAIDIKQSGTRNEEILLGDRIELHNKLRRLLHDRSPVESMTTLLKLIGNSGNNEELLKSLR
ncbi:MAG: transcription termination factor Rho [Armatimonadota bacterium]|nr:transcription termination factor Rho [Armatimonadota bacterium]